MEAQNGLGQTCLEEDVATEFGEGLRQGWKDGNQKIAILFCLFVLVAWVCKFVSFLKGWFDK
jgi:hypothetical protein